MIKEDYVSFEVAKLLKEKRFNEVVNSFYFRDKTFINCTVHTKNQYTNQYAAPTLQMALKWLREVHNLNINVIYDLQVLAKTDGTTEDIDVYKVEIATKHGVIYIGNYNHYESGCEAAIKYCLINLI